MVNENERTPIMTLFRKACLTYNKMLSNDDPTVSYANFKMRMAKHTSNNEYEDANIDSNAFACMFWRKHVTNKYRLKYISNKRNVCI